MTSPVTNTGFISPDQLLAGAINNEALNNEICFNFGTAEGILELEAGGGGRGGREMEAGRG